MNKEHLAILKKGVEEWNKWREENPDIKSDLSFTNLNYKKFFGANLSDTNLREAWLHLSDFRDANLTGANLSRSSLLRADFSDAYLNGTDLSQADLSWVNFSRSTLHNVNFKKCSIGYAIFSLTDLSSCENLDTVMVTGQCSIDFQTLRASRNLPKDFLFKIGLPENYINYLPDFYDETPLKLHPVFLSHNSVDKAFANQLYEALTQKRVHLWYDERALKPGDDLMKEINRGINL